MSAGLKAIWADGWVLEFLIPVQKLENKAWGGESVSINPDLQGQRFRNFGLKVCEKMAAPALQETLSTLIFLVFSLWALMGSNHSHPWWWQHIFWTQFTDLNSNLSGKKTSQTHPQIMFSQNMGMGEPTHVQIKSPFLSIFCFTRLIPQLNEKINSRLSCSAVMNT